MKYNFTQGEVTLLSFLLQGTGNRKYNAPVGGKTRLIKELFILEKGYDVRTGYEFVPYYFGPFCPDIYRDMSALESGGLVTTSETIAGSEISLTPKGVSVANDLAGKLDKSITKRMINCKERYNDMPINDLIQYVYSRWRKFTDKSLSNSDNILDELSNEFEKASITDEDINQTIKEYREESQRQKNARSSGH